MKKLILMLVCVCSTIVVSAQSKLTWGVEVGAGLSGWMGEYSGDNKPLFNPKVGVTLDIPITGFISFQTGLNWVSKGASFKMYDAPIPELENVSKVRVNQNYFQMPLLAAVHIGTNAGFDMVITGGPYLACGVCGKSEIEVDDLTVSWDTFKDLYIEDVNLKNGLKRFDAGIQLGFGLDFQQWTVGLDGDFSFCKIASGDAPYNYAFFLTAGYKF